MKIEHIPPDFSSSLQQYINDQQYIEEAISSVLGVPKEYFGGSRPISGR